MDALCRDCTSLIPRLVPGERVCPVCGSGRIVAHADLLALHIAHIDCDAFYAAVEKRDNPALRDQPVIVGHTGGRGVVTTACYVARRYGPRSAMPMFKALQLCSHAVVVPPDMPKYKAVSQHIRRILLGATPVVEPLSLDEAYLDLAPEIRSDPRFPAQVMADVARRIEREVGITVSIGLAANKFLAKLASDLEKPRGFTVIGQTEAASRLAMMPVRRLIGVGDATAKRLEASGITTIGQLQGLSEGQLVALYGRFGRRIAAYVRGEDDRPVTPERDSKSISVETTFDHDLSELVTLEAVLQRMCARLEVRLRRSGLAGRCTVLKVKTADFRILTRNRQLGVPSQRAEVVFGALQSLLRQEADGRRFRLLGAGMVELCDARHADPPDLFAAAPSVPSGVSLR